MIRLRCICGGAEFEETKHPYWQVSSKGETTQAGEREMKFGQCRACGLVRQLDQPFATNKEYSEYYSGQYPPTGCEYKAKDYKHDRRLAKLRCEDYGIRPGYGGVMLDIGSGSGAFVDECRDRGAEAYGCELAKYHYAVNDQYIYWGLFEDLNFPTDHFDWVTCHDVLEHVLDPVRMLEEMFRVVKQEGSCVIDLPRFFHGSGEHHWKEIEHVWFFNEEQLEFLLQRVGFVVNSVDNPVPSKAVFRCTKPRQERPTVLLPPGLGDSYWSVVKLRAFLKREGLGLPDVGITCPRVREHDGHKRSVPFLKMFPFMHCNEQVVHASDSEHRKIWQEAYAKRGRTVFNNVLGYDYFISYNGHLRFGEDLDKIDPDLACEWRPPMFVSLEQEAFRRQCESKYGPYLLLYFVFGGTYVHWVNQFPVELLGSTICNIIERTGLTPVFTGATWDRDDKYLVSLKRMIPEHIDLIGDTSLDELFGLIQGSEMVVGYPSGLTIMSAVLKKKTLILWNDYYNRDFAWLCAPPDVRRKTYFIENTHGLTVSGFADMAEAVYLGNADSIAPRVRSAVSKPLQRKSAPMPKVIDKPTPLTIACVLKSGGDFGREYVQRLHSMVSRHVTAGHEFVCLTDLDIQVDGCRMVPLECEFPGSWSKIELFRQELLNGNRIVYLDLDTIILGNIDDIISFNKCFIGLQPWNKRNRDRGMFASGMMSWDNNGRHAIIYGEFSAERIVQYPVGDQEYISAILAEAGIEYEFYQNVYSGIYSYKRNCRPTRPKDARIICFHGKPRPHELKEGWVREHWK